MTPDFLSRLFAHLNWADVRLIERINANSAARTDEVMRLLAHLIAAECIWLLRLTGQDSSIQPVWPQPDLDVINSTSESNRTGYQRYLQPLREEDLILEIAYTSQRGDSFRTQVGDILIHVALHGSYHRGQIAKLMRSQGSEPVDTDYISFVRQL